MIVILCEPFGAAKVSHFLQPCIKSQINKSITPGLDSELVGYMLVEFCTFIQTFWMIRHNIVILCIDYDE